MTDADAILFARALAVPNEQWKPITAPLRNTKDARSPEALRSVAAQFNVASSARYQPKRRADGKLETYCKTYCWDVTRAVDAELPHWVDSAGNPSKVGAPNVEVPCNDLLTWLEDHGKRFDWTEVQTEVEAATHAAMGKPAVAIWQNKKGPGHIALLLPSRDATTRIAQAGARCFFDLPLSQFGVAVKHLRFFVHP